MKKTPVATLAGVLVLLGAAGCAAPVDEVGPKHEVRSQFSQELHDSLPADVREIGVISVAGEANPPWRVVGTDNVITGFGMDILEEFSTILGVEFRTEMTSGLPAVKLGVQSGRNDIGFGPLLSNENTHKDMLFIDYVLGRPSFLYSTEDPEMTSLLDACGKTLAHIEGSVAFDPMIETMNAQCAEAGQSPVNLLMLADTNSTILAIESGRADVAGMSAHQAAYAESQNPSKFAKYITSDDEAQPDKLGMALDRNDPELARAVFGAWEVVFENGIYQELMDKYNMSEITLDDPELNLDAAGI